MPEEHGKTAPETVLKMKRAFRLCHKLSIYGAALGFAFLYYISGHVTAEEKWFALLLLPFSAAAAAGLWLHFKLPPKERYLGEKRWRVVSHPCCHFSILLVINVSFLIDLLLPGTVKISPYLLFAAFLVILTLVVSLEMREFIRRKRGG